LEETVEQKRALITGITGQDGSYLAELLLCKGYEVHGLIRRTSSTGTSRIDHLLQDADTCETRLQLHYADLCDANSLRRVLDQTQPHEVYNLAAQSHVRVSFDTPIDTADINALGTLRLLDAIREIEDQTGQQVKFYQASSSEMFGKVCEVPQTEKTPFYPRSPYAIAKTFAYWATVNYREAYGLHASNGILFNHESPRRGENFVTRKITRAIGRIKYGLQERLTLGNLDAQRDWGFTGAYVEAMWQMLQQEQSDDFVIATGETHSVREFLELAFGVAGLDHADFVEVDPRFFRPTEVDLLLGDSSKARTNLKWQPKVGFEELVRIMVEADLELAAREKTLRAAGETEAVKTLRRAA
jgi:GDPmannose 4,6-dehydratase